MPKHKKEEEGKHHPSPGLDDVNPDFSELDPYQSEEDEGPKESIKIKQHNKEFRQDCFIEAYVAAMGNITAARKLVKVDHKTVWRWFHKDENFANRLNSKMIEWEMMLRQKAFEMAMSGDRVMIIFLLKFVNPFFDDNYRAKVLLGEMQQTIYERHPIPQPNFLPPETPQRFRQPDTDAEEGGHDTDGLSPSLVYARSDK